MMGVVLRGTKREKSFKPKQNIRENRTSGEEVGGGGGGWVGRREEGSKTSSKLTCHIYVIVYCPIIWT
jgi:hypothetical protein